MADDKKDANATRTDPLPGFDAGAQLESNYAKAEQLLNDEDRMERFLQRLERKLKYVPVVGDALADIPVFAALLKNYATKEYPDIPLGSLLAVTATLIYFVAPVDIVPDVLPAIGFLDDAAVLAFCMRLVSSDIDEYKQWRSDTGRELILPGEKEAEKRRRKMNHLLLDLLDRRSK